MTAYHFVQFIFIFYRVDIWCRHLLLLQKVNVDNCQWTAAKEKEFWDSRENAPAKHMKLTKLLVTLICRQHTECTAEEVRLVYAMWKTNKIDSQETKTCCESSALHDLLNPAKKSQTRAIHSGPREHHGQLDLTSQRLNNDSGT